MPYPRRERKELRTPGGDETAHRYEQTASACYFRSAGEFEYTRFDLVRHNFERQAGCDNGRHEIHSLQPIGLTMSGWGSAETGDVGSGFHTRYVGYAYPGVAGVAPINTVAIPSVK